MLRCLESYQLATLKVVLMNLCQQDCYSIGKQWKDIKYKIEIGYSQDIFSNLVIG